jgi:hypothetical protein
MNAVTHPISSSNKPDRSPPHDYKVLIKEYSYEGQNMFLSLQRRNSVDILCSNGLFPLCKNYTHNNKNDTNAGKVKSKAILLYAMEALGERRV